MEAYEMDMEAYEKVPWERMEKVWVGQALTKLRKT